MSKVEVFLARMPREEGKRRLAYNDATGATVSCRPLGNLTIGEGIDLEDGLDDEEIAWLARHRAELTDRALNFYTWYGQLDDVVGSVALDVAFNAGVEGFVKRFPRMVAALERHDIRSAANECRVANMRLDAQRYAPLRQILLDNLPK